MCIVKEGANKQNIENKCMKNLAKQNNKTKQSNSVKMGAYQTPVGLSSRPAKEKLKLNKVIHVT